MFNDCTSLEYLDLSNFYTSNVINMEDMFNGCYKLKEINGLNKFITGRVLYMNKMFQDCNALIYLDLSNFNTSNVTNMDSMFAYCYNLKEIKGINNFNLSNVTHSNEVFKNCDKLKNYQELTFLFDENNNPKFQPIKELNIVKEDIVVYFTSIDQNIINYSMKCNNLDIFSTLIDKLCLEFDELKNKDMYFLANGMILNKNLTLHQNKIKDGAQILINVAD